MIIYHYDERDNTVTVEIAGKREAYIDFALDESHCTVYWSCLRSNFEKDFSEYEQAKQWIEAHPELIQEMC